MSAAPDPAGSLRSEQPNQPLGGQRIEVRIAPEDAGDRLDRALQRHLPDLSRSRLKQLILDRRVGSGGPGGGKVLRDPAQRVSPGQIVAVWLPEPEAAEPEAQSIALNVRFEDAHLIVIDKPAGMVVHPGAGHASGTVVNALLHHLSDLSGVGGELRPGIVHRLDRGTSGLMVVAKNDAAHHELARQFHDHEIEKEYIALVWGVVQAGRRIDAAIGRDPSNRLKMSTRASRARHAVTRITRAHRLPGLTLCQVAIHTGRTHQIRVHLSAIGHPIVGDSTYGGVHRRVAGDIRAVQRLSRPFLHSARLVFTHPSDGRKMQFIAQLPDDLTDVLNDLPGWPPEDEDDQ